MSYTKQNYKSGDVLMASHLNAMDDQIAENEQTGIELKKSLKRSEQYAFSKLASGICQWEWSRK